jgi:8-oxo-dGTP diphosphatase
MPDHAGDRGTAFSASVPHDHLHIKQIRMGQNVPMTISADDSHPVRIVTAVLRDGNRVLLCHRSAGRRWYPDVWDLPGGHVEEGEDPKESLVRELREELGITASEPSSPPMHEIRTATFDMQIWLIDRWTGTPVNAAPDEHDAVAWFETSDLDSLRLAHESYLSMLTAVLVT